jgi:hypothetical protein
LTFTSDKTSYTRGEIAHFTGSITNTSPAVCDIEPGYVPSSPVATDSAGGTVWTSGVEDGRKFADQSRGAHEPPMIPILPGEQVPSTTNHEGQSVIAPITFDWAFYADGTPSNPQPTALPDGTYTVSWQGLGDPLPTPVTLTLTLSG